MMDRQFAFFVLFLIFSKFFSCTTRRLESTCKPDTGRNKMFGIDNITNNNGWAMAVVGATTVFVGLIVLSFVISQIHRILDLWENRGKKVNGKKEAAAPAGEKKVAPPAVKEESRLPTISELTSIYRPLVEQLAEPFPLVQLYEKTKEMNLPHAHLSIKSLQEADILVAQGDGTFTWNKLKAI
jgi:hypothetical protein